MSLREVVTLASVVELETARPEERPRIAAVFRNRLRRRMPLQTDPTVIYALRKAGGYDGNIRRGDLDIDSPYNTYRLPGPAAGPDRVAGARGDPAPCCSRPTSRDLYFVSRNDGSHQFSENLADHKRAVTQYQRHRSAPRAPSPAAASPRRLATRPALAGAGGAAAAPRADERPVASRSAPRRCRPPPLAWRARAASPLLVANGRPIGAGDTRPTERVAASLVSEGDLDLDEYPGGRGPVRAHRRRAPRLDLSRRSRPCWPRRCSSPRARAFLARRDRHRAGRQVGGVALLRRRPPPSCSWSSDAATARRGGLDGGACSRSARRCGPPARRSGSIPAAVLFLCVALLFLVAGRAGPGVGRPGRPARWPWPSPRAMPTSCWWPCSRSASRSAGRGASPRSWPGPRPSSALLLAYQWCVLRVAAAARLQRQRRALLGAVGPRATSACSSRRPRGCSSSRPWSSWRRRAWWPRSGGASAGWPRRWAPPPSRTGSSWAAGANGTAARAGARG